MNPQASEGFSGLLEWSGPVIFDRLRLAYTRRIADGEWASRLARLHCRVWRALLMGDLNVFEAERSELVEQLRLVGLSLDCLAEADNQTMIELVEIVIARFRRSPHTSQAYHLALIQLASALRYSQAA
jgi:hypothetical protein